MDYSGLDALKELSYKTYGKDRQEVEDDINRKFDAAYGKKPAPEPNPLAPPGAGLDLPGNLANPASLYQ